ncbi:MAG: 50S ribosomal protein L11 methyltransferase [Muribaculaceae bacterium]|nr:50S ribosomal protein L11 methyltransferase [Muribaculaceae bacterium]
MYDYIALRIEANPCDETVTDLLAAFLADVGYDSFVSDSTGLTAYIRKDKYEAKNVEEILEDFPIPASFSYSIEEIEGEDWNKEWEQNYFKPIQIDDRVVVRSSFHQEFREAPIEIIIDPKMAFGTGHHATTSGMIKMLIEEDLNGKSVIDMGTGTGILSILCKKLGSAATTGIDIDEFAIENAKENGNFNGVDVRWLVGDDSTLEELDPSDIFLANINLNVITSCMEKYVAKMKEGAKIFLSGFLETDRDTIMTEAEKLGLSFQKESVENNWLVMTFTK